MANLNLSQIQGLLRQTGWPENLIAKMAAIVIYESSGNPAAHNPRGEDSWGLLQINWPYHREYERSRLVEPVYNLTAALAIYRREGVNAWYNSNRKYNQNLNGVAAQSLAIYNGGSPSSGNTATNNYPGNTNSDTANTAAKWGLPLVGFVFLYLIISNDG